MFSFLVARLFLSVERDVGSAAGDFIKGTAERVFASVGERSIPTLYEGRATRRLVVAVSLVG